MEENTRRISDTPAPYGRACTNCSRAKCKCINRSDGGSCERCHRLKKECQPSIAARKRNGKRSTTSKTAQLEEKLDGLVSLLKATQSAPIGVHLNPATRLDFGDDHNIRENHISSFNDRVAESPNNIPGGRLPNTILPTPGASDPGSTSHQSPNSDTSHPTEPSPHEAEEYLNIFRTQKSKHFPFIYIPSTTSAQQVFQERPFLWLCIMAMSSKSLSQQLALSNKIRNILAQKMLLENEKDLDLLLGLLAYIGWGHYRAHCRPSLTVFTQLAMSLVFDLGLNKPLMREPYMMLQFKAQVFPTIPEPTVRTTEERRAVLGCFLLASIFSSYLQKIDALRWTPHMDECLQTLIELQECPTDEILVQQVRLQLIVEKAAQVPWHERDIENIKPMTAPPAFYLKALQGQLQEVKSKLSPEAQQSEVMLSHLYITELTINEIALSKVPIISSNSGFERLESLYLCLNSIKSWFDIFFNIPLVDYIGFSFSVFSQLAHCLVALYKLSTLDDPAWDKTFVRNTVNLLLILDTLSNNMEEGAKLAYLDTDSVEGDVFTRSVKMTRAIRLKWEAKLSEPIGDSTSTAQDVDEPIHDSFQMDFSDDGWLNDLLVSWDR